MRTLSNTAMATGRTWAVVLAAGEGSRLRSLTTDRRGVATPKQFCSLAGGNSLLGDALARAERLAPRERVLVIVAAEHRALWEPELAHWPGANVVVQPRNRGTAPGILLPVLEVLSRDADARVALIPSDHWVADEGVLEETLRAALNGLRGRAQGVALLGIEPDAPEPDYGWIVPRGEAGQPGRVAYFVEKPDPAQAAALVRGGAVWNSFLIVARARDLLGLYATKLPGLLERFTEAVRSPADGTLDDLYAGLDAVDFSRTLLQGSEPELLLWPVPACGWTDLGTPERVARCIEELGSPPRATPRVRPVLDLAAALRRQSEPTLVAG